MQYNSPDEELCEANKIAAAKQDGYIAVAASGGAIDDYIRVRDRRRLHMTVPGVAGVGLG